MEKIKTKLRGVIYARYSEGPRQTDQSIEGQVADCQAYAAQHGINIIGLYADRHISGTSTEGRDEFLRMMHDADLRRFDCIVTWKIDRFGRSREDIAVNKIRLKKAGVQLHYAKESVPEGPEGILLESLLEGLAEYYSADLRQKVTRGIRESAKKGRIATGKLPIGYKRDPGTGRVVVDPEKAEAVREIFRLQLSGASVADMQQALYRRGIRTKHGDPPTQSTVYRMLRNERYLGRFEVQGIEILADPIIDRATFDDTAARFKPAHQNAAGRADMEYLLSCKCRCELCGSLLHGAHSTSHTGMKYYYYRCASQKKCKLKPVPKKALEDEVIRQTCQEILTDEMIGKLTKRIMEIQEQRQQQDPATALRKEQKQLKKKQLNLVEAIENGAGSSIVVRLNEVDARIEELDLEIERARLQRPVIPAPIVRGWFESFRDGDKDDALFRKRLIEAFVEEVVVGPEDIWIVYNTNEKEPTRSASTALKVGRTLPYSHPEIIDRRIFLRIRRNKKEARSI